jgi:hypothetical protein
MALTFHLVITAEERRLIHLSIIVIKERYADVFSQINAMHMRCLTFTMLRKRFNDRLITDDVDRTDPLVRNSGVDAKVRMRSRPFIGFKRDLIE